MRPEPGGSVVVIGATDDTEELIDLFVVVSVL